MRHAILSDENLGPPTRQLVERLVKEELRLLAQQTLANSDQLRIEEIHAALDRCCDVLNLRRAERERRQSPGQLRFQPEAIGGWGRTVARRPVVHVDVNNASRIRSLPVAPVTR